MKKLMVIALALFTLNGVAQEKKEHKSDRHNKSELRKEMTPNEMADLKSKKMTLHLDLTDEQQTKVHRLILKQSKANNKLRDQRKLADNKDKPSKEERLKMRNNKLDQMIEMKRELKIILTAEQYTKFEKMEQKRHKKKGKNGRGHGKKHNENH